MLAFGHFFLVLIAAALWVLNRESDENRAAKWADVKRTVESGSEFVIR